MFLFATVKWVFHRLPNGVRVQKRFNQNRIFWKPVALATEMLQHVFANGFLNVFIGIRFKNGFIEIRFRNRFCWQRDGFEIGVNNYRIISETVIKNGVIIKRTV